MPGGTDVVMGLLGCCTAASDLIESLRFSARTISRRLHLKVSRRDRGRPRGASGCDEIFCRKRVAVAARGSVGPPQFRGGNRAVGGARWSQNGRDRRSWLDVFAGN